ncbi:MAG: ATP-binding cassette domain-containing protein [Woeseiaceae bacterium]|nr:ATP-binding cassette domain-containing protein [Woeseiaceae bacterium]
MREPPLIEIRDATIWRGRTRVFDSLTLKIDQGEHVAVLGPNGSGKSTLLMAITRELYPVASSDTVFRILGRERWNVWDLRKHIGIVSHDLQARYSPDTTALDVVASGFHSSIGTHCDDETERRRALEIMRELGIAALHQTPFKRMSTGQQRRCLLGRSLVHEPDTLILDEPTAGLDPAASFDYLSRIRRLAAEGRSLVLVTHHINEIPPEIDRVVLLCDGTVIGDGEKRDMLTSERLSQAFGTSMRVHELEDYFVSVPDGRGMRKT